MHQKNHIFGEHFQELNPNVFWRKLDLQVLRVHKRLNMGKNSINWRVSNEEFHKLERNCCAFLSLMKKVCMHLFPYLIWKNTSKTCDEISLEREDWSHAKNIWSCCFQQRYSRLRQLTSQPWLVRRMWRNLWINHKVVKTKALITGSTCLHYCRKFLSSSFFIIWCKKVTGYIHWNRRPRIC